MNKKIDLQMKLILSGAIVFIYALFLLLPTIDIIHYDEKYEELTIEREALLEKGLDSTDAQYIYISYQLEELDERRNDSIETRNVFLYMSTLSLIIAIPVFFPIKDNDEKNT